MGFSDVKENIGMAYLTNDLSVYGVGNDPKFLALQRQFYKALEQYKKWDFIKINRISYVKKEGRLLYTPISFIIFL